MTLLHAASPRCACSQRAYFRARALRGRQRMGLVPLYSPAAATRDAAVGVTYSPAVTTRDVTAGGSTPKAGQS